MSQRKFISKEELSMMWHYLFYTFAIAWGTELLLIALYRFNLLSENITLFLYFTVIGFGAGMAPAYAAFIVQRKQTGIKLKAFCKQVFHTSNMRRSIIFLLLFAAIQFAACIVQESYLGNPWYLFILFIPMMIWGGGLEEIGWRGVFQTLLEKRFSFLAATFIEGVIWGVWHLPLWFIPNSTQGDMNFIAFTLYCIILGLTLAAAYRLTKCIWVTILIHAWGNTVLGGMYTLTSLNNSPSVKTLVVYALQIAAIMLILLIDKKHRKFLLK